jgi:hypothetical protein
MRIEAVTDPAILAAGGTAVTCDKIASADLSASRMANKKAPATPGLSNLA